MFILSETYFGVKIVPASAKIIDHPPENLDEQIDQAEHAAAALASERKIIQRNLNTELANGGQKGRALRAEIARINDEIEFEEQRRLALTERRDAEAADAAKRDVAARLAALVVIADDRIAVGEKVEKAIAAFAGAVLELDALSRELDRGVLALPVADRPALRNTVDDTRTGIPYNFIAADLCRMVPNADRNTPTRGRMLGDRLLAARQSLANHNTNLAN